MGTIGQAIQLAIALALPFAFMAFSPDRSPWWAIVIFIGEVLYALMRGGWFWVVPVSATIALVPVVLDLGEYEQPFTWGAAAVAIGAFVFVTFASRHRAGPRYLVRVAGLGFGIVLMAFGVIAAVVVGFQDRSSQETFTQAQQEAAAQWPSPAPIGSADGTDPVVGGRSPTALPRSTAPATPSAAIAALEFVRPGTADHLVSDGPLYVRNGIDNATLAAGPGRYPQSSEPGQPGNLAIAGHRTGYGSPFLRLDALQIDDEIHLTDRSGTMYAFRVVKSIVVEPDANWVLGPDPLGTGRPTITLTTCDPPHTNEARLVVFGELVDEPSTGVA